MSQITNNGLAKMLYCCSHMATADVKGLILLVLC